MSEEKKEEVVEYENVENLADMALVAAEMIRVASENPFDMARAAQEAKKAGAEADEHGQIRVRDANKRIPWMNKYNRFITFDGETPLQLTFTISQVEGYIISQFTVINNQRGELSDDYLGRILGFFFTGQEESMKMKTPPHVMCVVSRRRLKNADSDGK
jgi:hypothetical protein